MQHDLFLFSSSEGRQLLINLLMHRVSLVVLRLKCSDNINLDEKLTNISAELYMLSDVFSACIMLWRGFLYTFIHRAVLYIILLQLKLWFMQFLLTVGITTIVPISTDSL
jgi:hypothetical protein